MLSDEELRQAAGAYVAGDLGDDEHQRFEALLDQDEELRQEVAFWQRMRPHLARQQDVQPPDDGEFPRRLRDRLRFESDLRRGMRRQLLLVPAISAVAASLVTALLLSTILRPEVDLTDQRPGTVVMVSEFNDRVHAPMNLPAQFVIDGGQSFDRASSPWLGMSAREVRFVDDQRQTRAGYLVLQVASGAPADRAGLQPGDVVVHLGDCKLVDEGCLASTVDDLPPGGTVPIRFWRPLDATWHETSIEVRLASRIADVY